MSAAAIFLILTYTEMPDWLFYGTMAIPTAFIAAILFDVALEKWRVRA